jgi:hypothetical protein
MTATDPPLAVTDAELLARFILFNGWFRKDGTLRQDGFMPPPPDFKLSVTRHIDLSDLALWQIGQAVADARPAATLHGRADLKVVDVKRQTLQVDAAPLPENLNHANIAGWPPDKPAQKIIAIELAASARFVAR